MILRYFDRRDWIFAAAIVILIGFQVFLDLEIPGYMSTITVALEHGERSVVLEEGRKMLVCAFLSIVCAVSNCLLASRIAANVSGRLRDLQYRNVLRFSKQDVDSFSASSLITRSTNDAYQIQVTLARGLHIVVHAPILGALAIIKILDKDWHWTSATAVTLVFMVIIMALVMSYTVKRFKKIQSMMDNVNRATHDSVKGVRVIRAYNGEGYQYKRFEKANLALQENSLEVTRAMAFMFPIISSLMNFLTMAIYWIGADLIMQLSDPEEQILLFGDMIVFSSYAMQVISAFTMFSFVFRMLPRASVAMGRINEVIEHQPSVPDDGGEMPGSPSVEFEHVSFTYPGAENKAIDDVSFSIGPGETLAIIGPTGCGKSTLINLILRFYDVSEGSVRVGGVDVRECSQTALRDMLGLVPQQAILFNGSVKENVNYGSGSTDKTDEDVLHALDVAQARDFVEKLPDGLETNVNQYGRNLSGGQKQRLCIARAVCKKPEIYLLDDCFSALDYITDSNLRKALAEESENGIRIIVAQRIGTVMGADRILVLDKGKVAGMGTHDELMRDCSLYREIADSQITGGAGSW